MRCTRRRSSGPAFERVRSRDLMTAKPTVTTFGSSAGRNRRLFPETHGNLVYQLSAALP